MSSEETRPRKHELNGCDPAKSVGPFQCMIYFACSKRRKIPRKKKVRGDPSPLTIHLCCTEQTQHVTCIPKHWKLGRGGELQDVDRVEAENGKHETGRSPCISGSGSRYWDRRGETKTDPRVAFRNYVDNIIKWLNKKNYDRRPLKIVLAFLQCSVSMATHRKVKWT